MPGTTRKTALSIALAVCAIDALTSGEPIQILPAGTFDAL